MHPTMLVYSAFVLCLVDDSGLWIPSTECVLFSFISFDQDSVCCLGNHFKFTQLQPL